MADLRQKTFKVGLVGRALAVFRVNGVVIYNDHDPNVQNQSSELELIATLLEYMETPQYLRKLLFRRRRELRYAGILPPLRTPHHALANEKNREGDFREAVVLHADDRRSILELGLREKGVTNIKLEVGQRLTVRLLRRLDGDKFLVVPSAREETGEYWGFKVLRAENLRDALSLVRADYILGTSRYGKNIYESMSAIKGSNPKSMAIAFGGPFSGLYEICKRQKVAPEKLFNVIVNTIPEQGAATVRTEEALLATLALINVLLRE
jgi:predicted SPOUT superfamily RNA methylase MTH1